MDLFSAAWMTRSLDEAVAAVYLDEDEQLFAGGWDGKFKHWNAEGDLLWSTQLNDRISVISRKGDHVFATAGLHVTCLHANTGEKVWSHALEGSADSLILFGEKLYAISSVYDIEHNDFLESAIWCFSFDGTLEWVHKMNERPWVALEFENHLLFGLGRPKCGLLKLNEDEERLHISTDVDSPITSGSSSSERVLFGHADGTVSNGKGDVEHIENASIEDIRTLQEGYVVALENGELIRRIDAKKVWSYEGGLVTIQAVGFAFDGDDTHWSGRWSGSNSELQVRNCDTGELLAEESCTRCESVSATVNRVAVGFQNGQIHVWEAGMFERRLHNKNSEQKQSVRHSDLQNKLRALRER